MLLDCTLESLQRFLDFVSGGFVTDIINLTAIEIFEYLLLQLNKFSSFSCNIDYIELCPATLHMGDYRYQTKNASFAACNNTSHVSN